MASTTVTIADLRRILRDAAGAEEDVDLDGDILDVEFADLGYDSLALLETAARITQEFGVKLDDAVVVDANTPRKLLTAANSG
jgi:act minimal PKS acyl carrier protein